MPESNFARRVRSGVRRLPWRSLAGVKAPRQLSDGHTHVRTRPGVIDLTREGVTAFRLFPHLYTIARPIGSRGSPRQSL